MRRTVACDHAEACPGCPLIALPYDEQLVHKRQKVEAARARYPDLEVTPVLATLGADSIVEYRTRAKLIVAAGKLGLYAKGGAHEVVDVPRCRVLAPALAVAAGAVRARMEVDEATGGPLGALRAVDLRELETEEGSAKRVLLTLVVERSPSFRLEALREAATSLSRETPSIAGVGANFHDGAHPQILGAETVHLIGARGAFGAFTQAHPGQAAAILGLVADAVIEPGKTRILDLYGGSGAFALGLAARGAHVVLVESFAPAAAKAEADAARLGLAVKAIASDATLALQDLARRERAFDAAVVNPPRRGIHPDARRALAAVGPAVIAYVSCDPETLARDLDHFARLGFRASELLPFDMIPLTDHVETLAILRRAGTPTPRVLYEDDDVLAVAKPPHEPTTPQGEHEGSLLERVRESGARDAVPIHRLDVGTSGVVFFARTPPSVDAWSRALGAASAHKVYLAAVRGKPPEEGVVTEPIRDGKRRLAATTRFRRVAVIGSHGVLEVSPEQGRTHQIRIHLAGIGHPVLGDARYGHAATNRHYEEKHGLDRTFLHCARIELLHPKTGARLVVEAPLAGDLASALARMEGGGSGLP